MKKIVCIVLLFPMLSCWQKKVEVMGYAPIYGDATQLKTVSLMAAQPHEKGGKIFVIGTRLYQVEMGKGIHVTDIASPASPQKKAFIKIPGCQEVTVKNEMIITNNLNDLVLLNYANDAVTLIKRIPETFTAFKSSAYPPERGRFECPDKTKGLIIGWEKKLLTNANCSY